jgi:hypothetical protein
LQRSKDVEQDAGRVESRSWLTSIVCVWKIEDSLFEGWGEDQWQPADLSAASRLNAGGR